ncbi:hypothetical protein D6783_01595 [Candidatus Woesearchaeota archaeon]|nr:MAG: hypothetical protein D6783_01595 [Candidatus Woesearchaeota archaeon]
MGGEEAGKLFVNLARQEENEAERSNHYARAAFCYAKALNRELLEKKFTQKTEELAWEVILLGERSEELCGDVVHPSSQLYFFMSRAYAVLTYVECLRSRGAVAAQGEKREEERARLFMNRARGYLHLAELPASSKAGAGRSGRTRAYSSHFSKLLSKYAVQLDTLEERLLGG